jgi:hypothetical protein
MPTKQARKGPIESDDRPSRRSKTHGVKIRSILYETLPRDLFALRYIIPSTPLHFTLHLTSIMPKSCIICSVVASPDVMLQYCAQCQSAAVYCSRVCQRKDGKKQHRGICLLLNVGHGDMQVRRNIHTSRSIALKESFEIAERSLDVDGKLFFKLFEESTFEGSRAAAQKMKKFAKRQTKHIKNFLLFHGLRLLICSNSEMLSWPNSSLLVLLQCVDPTVLVGDELHQLADLADPFDYSTHENQLILAKQLIDHGANVDAITKPRGVLTPLHDACQSANVTNLDFVELLLEAGADPSAQDHQGMTPMMYTIPFAPGATKFLLNWPTTDANSTTRSGPSFLVRVRRTVKEMSDKGKLPNPCQVQKQFLLQQWRDIEEMLAEREALA